MSKIPVVSIKELFNPHTRGELHRACEEWGLFHITDHGVCPSLLDNLRAQSDLFFDLPLAEKKLVQRSALNPWGFYDKELTKNVRDRKEIFDFGPRLDDAATPWPEGMPVFRQTVECYFDLCKSLSLRLLGAIVSNLGMSRNHLESAFQPVHSREPLINYRFLRASGCVGLFGNGGGHCRRSPP